MKILIMIIAAITLTGCAQANNGDWTYLHGVKVQRHADIKSTAVAASASPYCDTKKYDSLTDNEKAMDADGDCVVTVAEQEAFNPRAKQYTPEEEADVIAKQEKFEREHAPRKVDCDYNGDTRLVCALDRLGIDAAVSRTHY